MLRPMQRPVSSFIQQRLRIAQIAPLWETVPPNMYGGTELVVYHLVYELLRMGHEVLLFSSGGGDLDALLPEPSCRQRLEVVTLCDKPLRESGDTQPWLQEVRLLCEVLKRAKDVDILHNHLGAIALPFAALTSTPMVTTLHNPIQPEACRLFYEHFAHLPLVSISNHQRTLAPTLHYLQTIYHGLIPHRYTPQLTPGVNQYLAFLGRFSPCKGPHLAIRIALETGWPLVMAGKLDDYDRAFFEREVAPHIDGRQIRFIGEVNHAQKVHLLRHAAATLCPVTWPEPFGLVLIESLACGTPVLALSSGSIPEIITSGHTGFVCDTVDELIKTVHHLPALDRRACRQCVENHFTVADMTAAYLSVYHALLSSSCPAPAASEPVISRVSPLPRLHPRPRAAGAVQHATNSGGGSFVTTANVAPHSGGTTPVAGLPGVSGAVS
jgi:glycosyltransferase involved in cell wall biosynthesis